MLKLVLNIFEHISQGWGIQGGKEAEQRKTGKEFRIYVKKYMRYTDRPAAITALRDGYWLMGGWWRMKGKWSLGNFLMKLMEWILIDLRGSIWSIFATRWNRKSSIVGEKCDFRLF